MCGRFTITVSNEELNEYLEDHFSIGWSDHTRLPRYNIAPAQNIAALIFGKGTYRLGPMTWGIDSRHGGNPLIINARAETVSKKPLFRPLFHGRRCLILADGFYEWKKDGKKREPYRIVRKDRSVFLMAGIYRMNERADPSARCAILTTEANAIVSPVHDRMPVILGPDAGKKWLDPKSEPPELTALLKPYDDDEMTAYPVSTIVNQATNDTKACILSIEGMRKGESI